MQVHLTTLGCRLNEAELEHWASGFQSMGYRISNSPDNADMVVINTCAVTREAVRKSKQMIRRTHRNNPKAKIIVSGCYSSLSTGIQDEIEGIDLVIPNEHKDKLVEITTENLSLKSMPEISTVPGESALFTRGRNRAFVKIQDGCRNKCTFCIVTVARGEERSRAISEIIDEINHLHSQDIHEIVLTGVHIGGYGSDLNSELYELIEQVLHYTDIPRVRLGSVEPWDLPDKFFSLFHNKKMMPHLHLPLQSGSNKILKRMARRCSTENFTRLTTLARETVAEFNITTDVIAGFPGETDEDWNESLEYIQKTGFSHIHIFSYSPRQGTRAASLPEQVDNKTKKSRSHALHQVARQLKQDYYNKYIGDEWPVLWETGNDNNSQHWSYGYTPNFMRVKTRCAKDEIKNQIINAKISAYDQNEEVLITGIKR